MTGGGTGGHLAIIKAVKEQLTGEANESHNSTLVYIGSTQGQDRQWFEKDNDFTSVYFLKTRGVVNQRGFGKIVSLWMLLRATLKARKLLKEYDAKVVFSVGGFSSAATAFAAKSLGIPLVIHEQNAAIGSLNKLLNPYATDFISSYLPESPIHAYPIKEIFFEKARVRKNIQTILFLGGSQGAVAINKLALSLTPILRNRGIRILHQAGEKNIEHVRQEYKKIGIEAEVFAFTTHLVDYMEEADFAIARAGASTLWELSANALPTLFIPYPYASKDHQYYNAQFLLKKDLAWLMRENEIDERKIISLLDTDLTKYSKGLMEIVEKEGAKRIAMLLLGF